MEAANPLGAQKGQKVKVVIAPQFYLKASHHSLRHSHGGIYSRRDRCEKDRHKSGSEANSDLWAFFAGMLCLVISFLFIRRYNKKVEKSQKYKPVIVEILS